MVARSPAVNGMKPPLPRADGRPADSDLIQLDEQKAKRHASISRFIDENLVKHQLWNKNYVDGTWRPLTPPLEVPSRSAFRTAVWTKGALPFQSGILLIWTPQISIIRQLVYRNGMFQTSDHASDKLHLFKNPSYQPAGSCFPPTSYKQSRAFQGRIAASSPSQ